MLIEMQIKYDVCTHPTKSRFLSVNTNDKTPFKINNVTIDQTDCYIYLGGRISNSPISNQIEAQPQQKYSHQVKFSYFLTKNAIVYSPSRKLYGTVLSNQRYIMAVKLG